MCSSDLTVHRVKENRLLVQQQVGVEGHAPGDGVGALKQGVLAVVAADPEQVVGDLSDTIHIKNLFSK